MLQGALPRQHPPLPGAGYLAAPAAYYGFPEHHHHHHQDLISTTTAASPGSPRIGYSPGLHHQQGLTLIGPGASGSFYHPSHQGILGAWEAALHQHRPRSPSPLDLSLKPTVSSSRSDGDEESLLDGQPRHLDDDEEDLLVVDDLESQRSGSSYRSEHQFPSQHHPGFLGPVHQQAQPPRAPPGTPHHHQLMTPPSTPSPPQCPRKRAPSPAGAARAPPAKSGRRKQASRRLKFDEETSSPVSGTVILGPEEALVVSTGDIDPAFNVVEVTEEARQELAKIENKLGPYQCKLCRQLHEDAFQLAQHRCSRIAHVEYRCPECEKRFSCPANLASHRRWHKPRQQQLGNAAPEKTGHQEAAQLGCGHCEAKFARQSALRKHLATRHPDEDVNNNAGHQQQQPQQQFEARGYPSLGQLQHQAGELGQAGDEVA